VILIDNIDYICIWMLILSLFFFSYVGPRGCEAELVRELTCQGLAQIMPVEPRVG
jgi:hypothetical protein